MTSTAITQHRGSASPSRQRSGRKARRTALLNRGARAIIESAVATMLWTQIGLFMATLICAVIFTHRPVVITGGSMRPVLDRGDVVIFDTPELATLRVGQIVMFDLGDGNVTHRIAGFNDNGTLITRGDANGITDTSPVPRDQVAGRARVIVPFVGLPLLWIQDGSWATLGAWGTATSVAAVLLLVSPQRQAQRERQKRWLASMRRKRARRRQPRRMPQSNTSRPQTTAPMAVKPQGQPMTLTTARPPACALPAPSTLRPRVSASHAGHRPSWPAPIAPPRSPSHSPWRAPRSLPAPLRTDRPTAPPKGPAPLAPPQTPRRS